MEVSMLEKGRGLHLQPCEDFHQTWTLRLYSMFSINGPGKLMVRFDLFTHTNLWLLLPQEVTSLTFNAYQKSCFTLDSNCFFPWYMLGGMAFV